MAAETTKNQTQMKELKTQQQKDIFPVADEEDFPTRRALEELNEATRKHYVTKHGGGTQTDTHIPAAVGPMDHEA